MTATQNVRETPSLVREVKVRYLFTSLITTFVFFLWEIAIWNGLQNHDIYQEMESSKKSALWWSKDQVLLFLIRRAELCFVCIATEINEYRMAQGLNDYRQSGNIL